ncbi:MAG TPA: dihydroorotase [Chitinophagaceae bacterium]|nr:dihydroorotase [Chitinophagaceae bacterium]
MKNNNILIKNILIINENQKFHSDVLIKNGRFEKIEKNISNNNNYEEINGEGKMLIPGVIDNQVHFREPGLTHKANIYTESRAAAAGGVTSFMEMPNTNPPTITKERLEEKFDIAKKHSLVNHSFFLGAANNNIEEVLQANSYKKDVAGIKIFMGSSTGNMLVDDYNTLIEIFSKSELLIATHCEDENTIKENQKKYPHANNASFHPLIRNDEACYKSSMFAVQLAQKYNSRLHILHISTKKELPLFGNLIPLEEKRITSEVCVHHLHFSAADYAEKGTLIQCNPAIKSIEDREALWKALLNDSLDIIATDHAPHTWEEKQQEYPNSPSGLPLVQHSLLLMLEYAKKGKISYEKIVDKMCHAPAICYKIKDRGYIREGFWADCVIVDKEKSFTITKDNILYKCNWSPLENTIFSHSIDSTFVNGALVYKQGEIIESSLGASQRLIFDRI